MIHLRFCASHTLTSQLIRWQAGTSMPFTPSHVEAVTVDGNDYIGAHIEDGVRMRPVGYDVDTLMTLADGSKADRIVSLPCPDEQEAAFYTFVHGKVGTPYDPKAILGFEIEGHWHDVGHLICSAFMAQGLRMASYFRWPLTKPFHHISPDLLFAILSTHVEIPH
ncbi:MAG TPA: hypothetical protein VN629_12400 [Castellaniella sp.]|nr:hypothetical protein [Castellaniella sp.]